MGEIGAMVFAEALARVIAEFESLALRWRSYLAPQTQKLVLIDPAFVVPRFGSRDWRSRM